MAKVTHVSQFAHYIAVKVLERFDQYGACKVALARDANGHEVDPRSPDATCMCVTGRIVNASPDGVDDNGDNCYTAPAVKEIARNVSGVEKAERLYAKNDTIFRDHGPDVLLQRTRRLFRRIARLPVQDENPTVFHVGGTYQSKIRPEKQYTVARIVPDGSRDEPIVKYTDGEWDRPESIIHYRRVA